MINWRRVWRAFAYLWFFANLLALAAYMFQLVTLFEGALIASIVIAAIHAIVAYADQQFEEDQRKYGK